MEGLAGDQKLLGSAGHMLDRRILELKDTLERAPSSRSLTCQRGWKKTQDMK